MLTRWPRFCLLGPKDTGRCAQSTPGAMARWRERATIDGMAVHVIVLRAPDCGGE
jgi:hypothetical protein